ncbi:hypothetical protein B0H14DRAFT_2612610 [Mycena olivaceomarginata]|nr:hypothetical protein B0H14DRAFT_2612610 [Mycena olivaceomarginata]
MPANDQTTRTPACGLPLPFPADFDFRAHCKTPSELVAPDMSLREKNAERTRRLPDPLLGYRGGFVGDEPDHEYPALNWLQFRFAGALADLDNISMDETMERIIRHPHLVRMNRVRQPPYLNLHPHKMVFPHRGRVEHWLWRMHRLRTPSHQGPKNVFRGRRGAVAVFTPCNCPSQGTCLNSPIRELAKRSETMLEQVRFTYDTKTGISANLKLETQSFPRWSDTGASDGGDFRIGGGEWRAWDKNRISLAEDDEFGCENVSFAPISISALRASRSMAQSLREPREYCEAPRSCVQSRLASALVPGRSKKENVSSTSDDIGK